MPPVPVKPGSYEIDVTTRGGRDVVTAGEHATEHAAPLITSRPPHPPFKQIRTIEPGEPVPGPPYVIRPTHHEQAGLVIAEDKLGVNDVPRRPWAQFTFEPALGGFRIRSDKGLSLRLLRPGEQFELAAPQRQPQEP
ncbi:hypothetical protein [Kitasatospora aureofaciens]|uniref:hypothetical protein n=1 Tax=Kitasatospora aureofaciens TaxID=1894 RepID=UPI0036F48D29